MMRIIGEAVLLGLVLVLPCFVIFFNGWPVKIPIANLDIAISLMQFVGLCFYLSFRTKMWAVMTGTKTPSQLKKDRQSKSISKMVKEYQRYTKEKK